MSHEYYAESLRGFGQMTIDTINIAERKRVEQALKTMRARLIEAREEECRRIARELHDDINQRIALIAVELQSWEEYAPEAHTATHEPVRHAYERILQLGKDIQALSHRLHPSTLDYVGLEAATNSFCEEIRQTQKVVVEVRHEQVPRNLPPDVALCIFRVLQESLQNAVKYSGVRQLRVQLRGKSGELQLIVRDNGIGFDQQEAMRRGLGLISMRERLQLVNGELFINSEPGHGTTVEARVPIRAEFKSSDA